MGGCNRGVHPLLLSARKHVQAAWITSRRRLSAPMSFHQTWIPFDRIRFYKRSRLLFREQRGQTVVRHPYGVISLPNIPAQFRSAILCNKEMIYASVLLNMK